MKGKDNIAMKAAVILQSPVQTRRMVHEHVVLMSAMHEIPGKEKFLISLARKVSYMLMCLF
jgi:hypothetical protein